MIICLLYNIYIYIYIYIWYIFIYNIYIYKEIMVMQVVILQNNIYKQYIRNCINYYMNSIIVYVAPPMEYFTEMIPTNVLMYIYV